jgi:hypothetical protein
MAYRHIEKGEKGKKALFTVHSTVVIDDMMKASKSISALYAIVNYYVLSIYSLIYRLMVCQLVIIK